VHGARPAGEGEDCRCDRARNDELEAEPLKGVAQGACKDTHVVGKHPERIVPAQAEPATGAGSKLPLTALVSSHDEARLLERCLPSIAFCDEVVVIDVDSTDDTAAVAEAHGARVVRHPYVPIAEWARVTVAPQARHAWILVVDPDEEVPPALAAEVASLLPALADDVAAVDAPRQYVFAGRALRGTVWGGPNKRRLLVRRSGVELTPTIWGGMRIRPGFRVLELPFTPETAIVHRWANGYRTLLGRHRRYVRLEAADRAAAGEVTGWRKLAATPWRAFHESFVVKRGYRDGVTGLALSLFWATFRTAGETALLRQLRR
jgi:glycosyltransferase involved in cell wall biosynthesis